MVYLTSRFLFLAALVATVAMPTFVLQSDARAVGLTERHSDKSGLSSSKHLASQFASSKNKGKTAKNPTVPLPASAKKEKSKKGKKSKDHKKGDHTDNKRGAPLPMADMLKREADAEHRHHHHHHHDKRQEQEAQILFSLEKRGNSRIYGKLSENREYSDAHGLENILKRYPEPHHHHHDHHDHDKVVVNGDNDKVHVHERRGRVEVDGGASVSNPGSSTGSTDGGANVSDHPAKRAPHHDHHDDHHDHHEHDKTVVNGDNDDVHIHERRDPHHHHHHHHDDHHDKTVINGSNDDVHVHERDTMLLETDKGLVMGTVDGQYDNRRDDNGDLFANQKRSEPIDSGVPGTVDIVAIGGPVKEKLASLILSSVPGNETAANSSLPLNGTKETEDVDAASSPFVLDASNATQTQFYLVLQDSPSASSAPSSSSSSFSSSLANTLAVLKAATSIKAGDAAAPDMMVKLQVPVFEASKAAESMYCATYDPNPPKPAPLTVERCETSDPTDSGKMTESSLHKSQTFAYNPTTQTLRLMWFNVSGSDAPEPPVNSTTPLTTPSPNSNSTSGHNGKQMNFKIQTSNKDAPNASAPASSSLPIQLPAPLTNVTQLANGTVSSTPVGNATASNSDLSSRNVALVFTPIDPTVRTASVPDDTPSFGPSDHSANSDPGNDDDGDNDVDSSSASVSTSVAASSTDSNSATSTDSTSAGVATTSFAVDASSTALGSTSAAATPTDTMMIDDAAIEKMFQHNLSS